MFYLPHNTTTLYNTTYGWIDPTELVAMWPAGRPIITADLATQLDALVAGFKRDLQQVDAKDFPPGSDVAWGRPNLLKLPRLTAATRALEVTDCIGAGIQY